ncbi:LacI family transcriptional regulator [Streptomyces sp. NP160]|uniref:LacI family DNA-binding transcriptional regulator n=1 Tax=Streptomyces sp. NP160 TaxID=2586637 RepID=UPI0011194AAF|nr:LacI family DNA-binding transcriptional regulator [Streptomyces sp. NP160]TNM59982.1 LacI family transcriptional regulator [Streptomyces sp. NP160]
MTAASPEHEPARRATIADIALRVGVTKGAVSYALNGKPGVSAETRRRVLEVARELDWVPSSAARMLAGNRTSTVGLALTRRPETLGDEPFFMGFVAGLEAALQPRGYGLLLQVPTHAEAELETYRAWAGERRVDGVVVLDPVRADPRPDALRALGLPGVVVGQARPGEGLAGVVTDDAAVMNAVVDHLADLGHTRVARVAGPAHLLHTGRRDRAFTAACRRRGLEARTVHADYSGDQGAEATAALVGTAGGAPRPTAVVYDNDLMAVAGLSWLAGTGLRVPEDVSLVAWDDSATCRATHPALTATGHDVVAFGRAAAEALFRLLDDDRATSTTTTPELRVRASTAQAPSTTAGARP